MTRFLLFFFLSFGLINSLAFSQGNKEVCIEKTQESAAKTVKVSQLNANLLSKFYDIIKETGKEASEGFVSLKDFTEISDWFVDSLRDQEKRKNFFEFLLELSISLGVAYFVAGILNYWTQSQIEVFLSRQKRKENDFIGWVPFLSIVLLCMIQPLVFGVLAYSIFRFLEPATQFSRDFITMAMSSTISVWIFLKVARVFLKPRSEAQKKIPLYTEVFGRTYKWFWRMSIVALFSSCTIELGKLINLPYSGYKFLLQVTTICIVVMTTLMILKIKEPLLNWITIQKSNKRISKFKKSILNYVSYGFIPLWMCIILTYLSWVSKELDWFQIFLWKILFTLFCLPIVSTLCFCCRKIRVFYIHKYCKEFSQKLSSYVIFYGRQLDFVTNSIIWFVTTIFALNIWGVNLKEFLFSRIGLPLLEAIFSIFLIITSALFLTRMGSKLFAHYLNVETKQVETEQEKQQRARLKTLHSVSRNILRIIIWVPAILLIAAEFDIDVMPILATVGVLSVGLSFGVQSLIQDFVTGFFMLLENAFAVGDMVTVNNQAGKVESLTVRVLRIRSLDGALHIFPYGKITSLSNQNRDYSAAVISFYLGLSADLDKVIRIVYKIGEELKQQSDTKRLIIGQLELNGINNMSDSAIEIRLVINTQPTKQYKVKWAFYRLLKKYLDEEKIPLGKIPTTTT